MAVKPIPEGYHSITPYLIINEAAKAIDWYKNAFGAQQVLRMEDPSTGRIGHAELKIGDSYIMLADEHPDMGYRSPKSLGGAGISLLLYVKDVDNVVNRAVDAGAKLERPVQDQFYGDRMGTIHDPFGHVWSIATHIEDVSPEEMLERSKKAFQQA
jgi:PhnB protein